jgi:lysophospholipase L1-like esterase
MATKGALLVRHRRLFRVLLGVTVPVVLLLLLETGSYLFGFFPVGPDPMIAGIREEWASTRRWDPLLFWSLKPGLRQRDPRTGVEFRTNELGLRGPEVPAEKGDEFRILSLGESTTFGESVEYDECYSARLQKSLPQVHGRPVRVINAGVPGYALVQGCQYLEHRGIDLEPDVVLLYFGINDFLPVTYLSKRDAMIDGASKPNDWELLEQRQACSFRVGTWMRRHSNLVRAMASVMHEEPERARTQRDSNKVRVPPGHRRKLLSRIEGFCAEHGIHLLVIIPWYLEFEAHEPLLRSFVREHGVAEVDLPRLLGSLDRTRYFTDPMHPNAAGHAAVAQAIEEVLAGIWKSS